MATHCFEQARHGPRVGGDRLATRAPAADLSPLRDNPAYRRLWVGNTCAGIGSQMAVVAIGLQVYSLTSSTAAVGAVAAFAFVPLVVMGLYGGALSDR